MTTYTKKLKYLTSPAVWLENSYGLKCCPTAKKLYDEENIQTCVVPVNNIFSDMEEIYPGFGDTIFSSTILETFDALRSFVSGIEDTVAFERWLAIVFADCPTTSNIVEAIVDRMSQLYIRIAQIVTERLRGESIYVIGYSTEGLLLVSKEGYPVSHLKTLLGGLL